MDDRLTNSQSSKHRIEELQSAIADMAVRQQQHSDRYALETIERLLLTAQYSDDNTLEHTRRVALLAVALGRELGLSQRDLWLLERAAPLHDLGKVAVPDEILLKQDRLTADEYAVVKTHCAVGARILEGSDLELVRVAETIVRSHHERWDGRGYPEGLHGARIPLMARIVHVADVFDVLVHERPHKEAWTFVRASEELKQNAGKQFDEAVVAAFEALPGSALPGLEQLCDRDATRII